MRNRVAVLGLLAAIAGCEATPVAVPDAPGSPRQSAAAPQVPSKIGPGVVEAIQLDGSARVMVAFRTDTAVQRRPGENFAAQSARMRAEIAGAQIDVLSRLDSDAFMIAHQYEAVPALAGVARDVSVLEIFEDDPNVLRVDLDVGGTGHLSNSVAFIGADQRQALGNDGEGVVVAILDTGMDTDHPDLSDDVLQQACFGDNDGTIDGAGFCPNGSDRQTGPGAAEDDAGHGTHVSGIVTSKGTVSAPGTAPGAGIVPIKVLNNCAFSGCFFFFSEIVAGLNFIITNNATLGVQVINMSLGTNALFTGNCDTSTAFNMAAAAAINTLRGMGVIAFASSGNNGSGTQMPSPACLSNVMSVGATDNSDNVAGISNSNATTDIFGPGVSVVSLAIGGATTTATGTSMASPHAAGCAALLIQSGEAVTPAQIETRLETSTFQVTDPTNGLTFPRIDCSAVADNTSPNITAGVAGTLGNNGWYTSDVAVTWTVTDAESTVTSTTGCGPSNVTSDTSGDSFTCSATSAGGTASASVTIKRDATDPTVTYSGNVGPYDVSDDVAITCTAADGLSGLASDTCADISGPAWSFPLGTNSFSATAEDLAGNTASGSTSFEVTASFDGLCALVESFVSHAGTTNSMCAKIRAAERSDARGRTNARDNSLSAFINEVAAQTGKRVDPDDAAVLITIATALMS